MYKWLHRIWYEGGSFHQALLPLSGIYWLLITLRRSLYRTGFLGRYRAAVPVIIVGVLLDIALSGGIVNARAPRDEDDAAPEAEEGAAS